MAADGMGVTLLPKALVAPELDERILIEVDVDWLPQPLHFAARYQSEKVPLYLPHCATHARDAALAFRATQDQS